MTTKETNAARVLGRKGGSSKSEAKVRASRDNGKLGGRPTRKPSSDLDEDGADSSTADSK